MQAVAAGQRSAKRTAGNCWSFLLLGFLAALAVRGGGCFLEFRRAEREKHPISRLQAEAVARETLKQFCNTVYGTNGDRISEKWTAVEATYVGRRFRFDYRLSDGKGNARSGALGVDFDEKGEPSLRFR